MKSIIHVNKNIIQYNGKHGTSLPVCRVSQGGKTRYGSEVNIDGPSKLVYRDDSPLSCGAKLWIETEAEVSIKDCCTFRDIMEMKKELR